MPHQPGHPDFEAAYQAAVTGQKLAKAEVRKHPATAIPRSLKDAWQRVPASLPEWKTMEPETRARQDKIASKFLGSTISEEGTTIWGDVLLADLKRRHVKGILAGMSDTPHAGRHLLAVLRRMILIGLDEEWIDSDPAYKPKHRPEYKGWKAWPDHVREKFEERWPIGTTPRLTYCLALWLGNRRGDVATLAPSAIHGDKVHLLQGKTGRALVLGVTPMLREVLNKTDLSGPAVLMTAYGEPFSAKSLTGRMADWTKSAGLPPGYTLHGLRKTLGKMLAESGSTTREIMDTLGHTDIKHAELYLREAEQALLASADMGKVVNFVKRPLDNPMANQSSEPASKSLKTKDFGAP